MEKCIHRHTRVSEGLPDKDGLVIYSVCQNSTRLRILGCEVFDERGGHTPYEVIIDNPLICFDCDEREED
jgi:hypothetical protein